MKSVPHLSEILDPRSPYSRKYRELVSRPDYCDNTETHHIVPVAYFEDVLGMVGCRTAGSPDMYPENLVPLSRGHHVLAHFYLAKAARKCIAVQMRNAFCLTFQTTDFSKVTEEDVLSRIGEINAGYKKMKSMRKEHKDGTEIRRTATCVSLNSWKDRKPVGVSVKWSPDGTVREIHDHDMCFTVNGSETEYGTEFKIYGDFRKGGRMAKDCYLNNRINIWVYQYADSEYGGHIHITLGRSRMLISFSSTGNFEYWEKPWNKSESEFRAMLKFLNDEKHFEFVKCIRSIRPYARHLGRKLPQGTSVILRKLEDAIPKAEPLAPLKIPKFPANAA